MRSFLFGLLLAIGTPSLALAWGDLGHWTVAEMSVRYLSPQANAAIEELLDGGLKEFVEVAPWADEIIEERPESYPWHVVEIPPDGASYDRARDCKNDNCIVEKIKEFARIVGDRRVGKAERVDALKFLIHFVGDLHMPLHAFAPLNRPKGTSVQIGTTTEKLHLWWDYVWWDAEFKRRFGSDPGKVADSLTGEITADERKAWSGGTVEDWTNESFRISYEFVSAYDIIGTLRAGNNSEQMPIVLPQSALDEMKSIVVQRLKMAGVRLAWLLNEAFK